jgi:hypothetical protein
MIVSSYFKTLFSGLHRITAAPAVWRVLRDVGRSTAIFAAES